MELFVVYDGGQRKHLKSDDILMRTIKYLPKNLIISDAEAQTIASWWHSPAEPLSTVLSTQGKVDRRMNRETFATDAELAEVDDIERAALDALVRYIEYHIANASSASRECACRDCMDLTTGIVGEMCSHCEDAGCEYGEECSVESVDGCEEDCNH